MITSSLREPCARSSGAAAQVSQNGYGDAVSTEFFIVSFSVSRRCCSSGLPGAFCRGTRGLFPVNGERPQVPVPPFCRGAHRARRAGLGDTSAALASASVDGRGRRHQTQRGGLGAVQDGAAGLADGHARPHFFPAAGAVGGLSRLVEPFLLQSQMARGAALHVVDEDVGMRAFPFAIGRGHHGAVEHVQPPPGLADFIVRGRFALSHEDAEEAVLAAVGVDFAAQVLGHLASRNGHVERALIAQIHHGADAVHRNQCVRFARRAAADVVGAVAAMNGPALLGQIYDDCRRL